MATKSKKRTSYPAPTTRKVKIKKKKSSGRSKRFLSESWASAGKNTISGAMGGGLSLIADLALPNQSPTMRAGAKILGGFLIGKFTGASHVGAGMAGAGMSDLLKPAFGLAEGGFNGWAADMQPLPTFVNENGFALSEQEAYLLSQGMERNDASYVPGYMPMMNY